MELYQSCTTVVFAGKQKLFFKKIPFFNWPAPACRNVRKRIPSFSAPVKTTLCVLPSRVKRVRFQAAATNSAGPETSGPTKDSGFPPVTPGGQFFFLSFAAKTGPFIFRDSYKIDRHTSLLSSLQKRKNMPNMRT